MTECGAHRPGWGPGIGRNRLPCIREQGHAGEHQNAFLDTWPDHAGDATIKPNVGGIYLTPDEIEALRTLVDDLVAATDNNTFWFNRVRDTAIELQETLNGWLEPHS